MASAFPLDCSPVSGLSCRNLSLVPALSLSLSTFAVPYKLLQFIVMATAHVSFDQFCNAYSTRSHSSDYPNC
ncbi:hypothetical protein Ciccas_005191 [Cichlidogyrus casuarinus]|uniref:Uncharacterized protein n=1 Tax=Cichlidogyrus casuarinus TaxID=1844966 RepID=A0ABD2Q9C7_9PLAT